MELAEHSYYEGAKIMPSLNVEDSEIIVDGKEPEETSSSTPFIPVLEKQQYQELNSNAQKRKATMKNKPDSDEDPLEDDDLHFKGFCYTTTGPDGTKSINDTFACPYCPAFFDSRVGLTNHAKLHGAAKKMKCELCDFACTNKKTMRLHRRIHGIIPVRGRRSNKDRIAQPRSKETKLDVEKLDLDPPYEQKLQTTTQEDEDQQEFNQSIEIRRSTRQRLTKSGNACPTAGAVTFTQITEEEGIVIITANQNEQQAIGQIKKNIVSKINGLEEEDEEIDVEDEQHNKGAKNDENEDSDRAEYKRKRKSASRRSQQGKIGESPHILSCSHCPYQTSVQSSLDQHMIGHSRSSGYSCSVCSFKHEYKRWLHQHCMLHQGIQFQWPPEYVYGEEERVDDVNVEDDKQELESIDVDDVEPIDVAGCSSSTQ